MGESQLHIDYVEHLVDYVREELLGGDVGYVLTDHPRNSSFAKPPAIYGHVPDLYVPHGPNGLCVIGEAKSGSDIENRHTFSQLGAFLRRLGESEVSYLVAAVPWFSVNQMKGTILAIQRQVVGAEHVHVVVLRDCPS